MTKKAKVYCHICDGGKTVPGCFYQWGQEKEPNGVDEPNAGG